MVAERWRRDLRRAYERRGYEREVIVLILRCIVAATAAFGVGSIFVSGPQVGFAPFSALLVVRPSVYGSILQSGRYVAAVFLGALLAGVAGLTVGSDLWVFVPVLLVALALGQLRVFGSQGTQIPVLAAFALAGGTATNLQDLGWLLAMVLVGALAALATNAVFAPIVRFRDAKNAVLDFADSLRHFTQEMSDGLREGKEGIDLGYWSRFAESLEGTARNAHESVERQADRLRFNPRHMFVRRNRADRRTLVAYHDWITALSRGSQHLQSLVRTLRVTTESGARFPEPGDEFLHELSNVLGSTSQTLQTIHDYEEPGRGTPTSELSDSLDRATEQVEALREEVSEHWDRERWPSYSAFLTDLERLIDELRQGHERRTGEDTR